VAAGQARNEKVEVGGLYRMHARDDEQVTSYGKKLVGKSPRGRFGCS